VRLADSMKRQSALTDVDTDQQENSVETFVNIDRDTAARLGISARDVDNALYNAFGQRQVATIYDELNQYHVIMEVAPRYARTPEELRSVQVPAKGAVSTTAAAAPSGNVTSASAANGSTARANGGTSTALTTTSTTTTITPTSAPAAVANPGSRDPASGQGLSTAPTRMVPLAAFASFDERSAPTAITHSDGELSTTISFNLAESSTLSEAQAAVLQAEADIGMPTNVRGSFQGTARSFQASQDQQPLLIGAALVVIYIVLGILYESLVHPVTVLSTLPSAGVGALMALLLFNMEFSIMALIGIFLLIGIVKKNAILIIDFALEAERSRGLSAYEAVREACLLRFRPILMTTLAAALGALPLAVGFGEGAELRRPLGVAIVGGLIASQILTLLTTPVVYILLDKLRRRSPLERNLSRMADDPLATS
jgi:multidrug efflux pump